MEIGEKVPPLQFKATGGLITNLDRYQGHWLVIYFYPKDATTGCTTQGCDFRDLEKEFSFLNAIIFGVSRDSLASHERFKAKQNFAFDLISDAEESLCQAFDVIKKKSLYGKEYMGIERSTFILDPKGIVRHIWRNVKVKGHVEEVLAVLKTLTD